MTKKNIYLILSSFLFLLILVFIVFYIFLKTNNTNENNKQNASKGMDNVAPIVTPSVSSFDNTWKTYNNKKNGYSIDYPNYLKVYEFSSDNVAFRTNEEFWIVSVKVSSEASTTEQYLKKYKKNIKIEEVLKSNNEITVFSSIVINDDKNKKTGLIDKGGKLYEINIRDINNYSAILKSFKFLE